MTGITRETEGELARDFAGNYILGGSSYCPRKWLITRVIKSPFSAVVPCIAGL